MNRKLIFALIFILALGLCVSSVSAASLHPKNFENDFTVSIPKGSNFVKTESEMEEDAFMGIEMEQYIDESNMLILMYVDSAVISDDSANWWYSMLFESVNSGLDEYLESQSGNAVFMRPDGSSDEYMSLFGVHSGNETLMIMGMDKSLVEEMGNTVKL